MTKPVAKKIAPKSASKTVQSPAGSGATDAKLARGSGPINDVLDFSFVEVLADERRVVETGGSCASCS